MCVDRYMSAHCYSTTPDQDIKKGAHSRHRFRLIYISMVKMFSFLPAFGADQFFYTVFHTVNGYLMLSTLLWKDGSNYLHYTIVFCAWTMINIQHSALYYYPSHLISLVAITELSLLEGCPRV